MVVVPALNEGEMVTLPAITTPDPKAKDTNPIEATIAVGDRAVLNDERMPLGKLWDRLAELHKKEPERKLRLKTDQKIPYKTVRESFAKVQAMGFRGVSLKVETVKQDEPSS
jgi:biopolymer transport protein ExbD